MRNLLIRTLIAGIVLCICACSTSNQGTLPGPVDDSRETFAVTLDEGVGTFVPELKVERMGPQTKVTIEARDAEELSAAYLHLQYDVARYTPARVEFGEFLGSTSETLSLSLVNIAGEVPVGIAQIPSTGVTCRSGEGYLATVYFHNEPFSEGKVASAAPSTDINAVRDLRVTEVQGVIIR